MDIEYPGATDFVQARWYAQGPQNRFVDTIVFHITDGGPAAENTAEYFSTTDTQASAHFVIGQDGTVIQCVAMDDIAWHAHGANRTSIGIEHCARSPAHLLSPAEQAKWGFDDEGLPLSEAQLQASAALVTWLCKRYDLDPSTQVLGHTDADKQTDHTDCPYGQFNRDEYIALIQSPGTRDLLAQILNVPLSAIDTAIRAVRGTEQA
jgi:N-acetyl-anhydromuramyl-L-alanine amidase AmpD